MIYDRKSSFTNDFAQGFFADKIRELPPVNSIRPDCENCKKVTKAYFDGQYYADSLEVEEQEPKTDEENIYREREQAYMQGYEDASKKYRQEPKTGHWIETDSDDACWYMCSECHRRTDDKSDYCPNCGASMVEPQKSEEQA